MKDKLTYEDFYDFVWNEYISEKVVTDRFIEANKDLIVEVTYDIYHVYKQTGNISESVFAKIILQSFRNIIRMGVVFPDRNSTNDAYDSF